MTAKQSNASNWAAVVLTVLGAGGTGVWWAATLSAKVEGMQGDIAYIKDRIDGRPAAPRLPLTESRTSLLDSLQPVHAIPNDTPSRTAATYAGGR